MSRCTYLGRYLGKFSISFAKRNATVEGLLKTFLSVSRRIDKIDLSDIICLDLDFKKLCIRDKKGHNLEK